MADNLLRRSAISIAAPTLALRVAEQRRRNHDRVPAALHLPHAHDARVVVVIAQVVHLGAGCERKGGGSCSKRGQHTHCSCCSRRGAGRQDPAGRHPQPTHLCAALRGPDVALRPIHVLLGEDLLPNTARNARLLHDTHGKSMGAGGSQRRPPRQAPPAPRPATPGGTGVGAAQGTAGQAGPLPPPCHTWDPGRATGS